MKPVLIFLFLLSSLSGGLNTISRINEYAQTAAIAYGRQEYIEAIAAYEYLLHDLEVQDDQLQLNLAHSYYQAGMLPEAQQTYHLLTDHPTLHLRAVAHLQLGNIATQQKKYKQALTLYKKALMAQPSNDAARYNYELVKKYLALHPELPEEEPEDNKPAPDDSRGEPDSQTSPPPAQENLEPQPKKSLDTNGNAEAETDTPQPDNNREQEQKGGGTNLNSGRKEEQGEQEREQASGSEAGDTEGQTPDGQFDEKEKQRSHSAEEVSDAEQRAQTRRTRLQQVNMSPEKARLLLDAMRNAERQYIQQLPKKSSKTPDKSKPDW
jgi:tetratricopeptide (TPR) repeat protein